jgi:hypothetical protein
LAVHQRPNWFGDAEVTLDSFGKVVNALLSSCDPAVVPPQPEPASDTRPRHNDGTFKSEFEVWASDPRRSMAEIRLRARSDEDFGKWFRQTYSDQIQQEGYKVAGEPTRIATSAERRELEEFARSFTMAQSSTLKPIAGRVTMAGKIYPYETFRSLVDKCSEIGLL